MNHPIPDASPKTPAPGSIGGGVAVAGGVDVFRAACLASSLAIWAKHKIIPTRGVTITAMLAMAHEYTGTKYPRTVEGAQAASVAVRKWADDAKAAINAADYPRVSTHP